VRVELFHVAIQMDEQTDIAKLINGIFSNTPKNYKADEIEN
jgi:hypothetical protein